MKVREWAIQLALVWLFATSTAIGSCGIVQAQDLPDLEKGSTIKINVRVNFSGNPDEGIYFQDGKNVPESKVDFNRPCCWLQLTQDIQGAYTIAKGSTFQISPHKVNNTGQQKPPNTQAILYAHAGDPSQVVPRFMVIGYLPTRKDTYMPVETFKEQIGSYITILK
jgi:hypothetical protein